MRLFIAVILPEELKQKIEDAQRELSAAMQRQNAAISWVKPEQFHFTVKFLGECLEDQVPRFLAGLETTVRGAGSFSITLGRPGYFPDKGPLQSFWLGLSDGADRMTDLAGRVETACEPLGFPREKRPFRAHMTLGRVKSARNPDGLRQMLTQIPFPLDGTFKVGSIQLVRSILGSSGPAYTTLKTVSL